jgi:hypothetical protein
MQKLAPGLRRWTAWHDHWEEFSDAKHVLAAALD